MLPDETTPDIVDLLKMELERRFPTDLFTITYGAGWWGLYVNKICYFGGGLDRQKVVFYRPYHSSEAIAHESSVLSVYDPALFEKAKELALRNMIYYEQFA